MDTTISRILLALSVLLAALGGPLPARAQTPPAPLETEPRELMDQLRRGGHVIYFRHAATNPEEADTDLGDLGRCESQRNLSAAGRRTAREIGAAFQTLQIPVGRVLASPYCRTVDTARLAFGRHETSSALHFAIGIDKEQRARQSEELRRMLATPPPDRSNVVIVSHHGNLKEATGIWPKREGDAHVFRPRPGGGFDYLGEVPVGEWHRQAGRGVPAARAGNGS